MVIKLAIQESNKITDESASSNFENVKNQTQKKYPILKIVNILGVAKTMTGKSLLVQGLEEAIKDDELKKVRATSLAGSPGR